MPVPLNLVPIFAAPFASGLVPEHAALNERLLPVLLARAAARPAGTGLYESAPDLLQWRDPAVQQLKQHLIEAVTGVVAGLNGYGHEDLAGLRLQARAWLTVVEPGHGVPLRSHPMASWCAIYCVQAPEAVPERMNGGALSFYDPRLGNMYLDGGNARLRMPFGHGHFAARAIAGQMVAFPAHLLHETMPLQGATPLVTVTAVCRYVGAEAAR